MERILLLVDVAKAPTEREGENDDTACEAASDSATLGKEWPVTGVSGLHRFLIVWRKQG